MIARYIYLILNRGDKNSMARVRRERHKIKKVKKAGSRSNIGGKKTERGKKTGRSRKNGRASANSKRSGERKKTEKPAPVVDNPEKGEKIERLAPTATFLLLFWSNRWQSLAIAAACFMCYFFLLSSLFFC